MLARVPLQRDNKTSLTTWLGHGLGSLGPKIASQFYKVKSLLQKCLLGEQHRHLKIQRQHIFNKKQRVVLGKFLNAMVMYYRVFSSC